MINKKNALVFNELMSYCVWEMVKNGQICNLPDVWSEKHSFFKP